jgi:peptide/nickel transport system substrate-binding protein
MSLSLAMLVVGVALLVAAGLATAGVTSDGAAEARKGGTLRLSTFGDVDYVDPALMGTSFSWPIGYATCARLFGYPDAPGAEGTRLIHEVVRGFRVSRDGKTYTFELKRTFRFHTGAPVTARSFADAFERNADPRMKSPAASYMSEIVGANAVISGKARSISGVRVLGRYRLQIRLTKPLGDFTARLTMPFFCPILPNTPVDPAGTNTPAGSGPYYVAERVVNQRIVLRRNPYYGGDRPVNVDQVVWTISESLDACIEATEQNRIDHCVDSFLSSATAKDLQERYGLNRPGGQFFVKQSMSTWYLAFNHDRPAFKGRGQIALKKAINYAIDRPAIVRAFGYLGGKRTDQILPPALAKDTSLYPLKGADPATARKWLARTRFKPEKLVLYTNNAPVLGGVPVAQVIVFNLRQIGIDVDVKYFDWPGALFTKAGSRAEPFDFVFAGWTVDYADPAAFFVPLLHGGTLRPTGNFNLAHFDDRTVNARIDAANRLTGAARRGAWADLESDLMRDNPPWAPLFNLSRRHFISRSYGCYFFHPVYLLDIAAACKK